MCREGKINPDDLQAELALRELDFVMEDAFMEDTDTGYFLEENCDETV